jgi:antagonist of KipI
VVVPLVLGSRSTYLRAGFGGLEGRALRAGDELLIGEPSATGAAIRAALFNSQKTWNQARFTPGPNLCPAPRPEPIIRAVRGPEYAQFSAESQQAFWRAPFTVSTEADRMGCRLHGPGLVRLQATELLSSAVTFGTVQVPAGGQPIVLLADHQTTGGYPRIVQVISADFSALAQLRPGQQLRFQEVTLAEAQALYLAQEARVRALRRGIETVFGD